MIYGLYLCINCIGISHFSFMNNQNLIKKTCTSLIASIWIINCLFCKVLNLVPRHQLIVSRILGFDYAAIFTNLIGVAEVLMGLWILSRYQSKLNTVLQIVTVATMNVLEFFLVPDLLLFGKLNAIFAFTFIVFIYFNEFLLLNKEKQLLWKTF